MFEDVRHPRAQVNFKGFNCSSFGLSPASRVSCILHLIFLTLRFRKAQIKGLKCFFAIRNFYFFKFLWYS